MMTHFAHRETEADTAATSISMQAPFSNAYPASDHAATSPNNVETQDTKTSDEARAAAGEVMAHWAEHESQTFEEKKRHGNKKGAHHKNGTVGPKKENGYPKTVEISSDKDATLGEYFKGAKNFSMFSAGTNTALNFKTSERQLEGTATHELAHGLLRYELGGFNQATGCWLDAKTKSGAPDAEVPPTSYGKTNASEDLSESAMFFFMAPQPLQEKCPKRHKFLKGVVESWHSQKPGGAATK